MPAKSKAQQSAAALALQAKQGDIPVSKLKGEAKSMYDSMTAEELRDFAETPRKNLPEGKKFTVSKSVEIVLDNNNYVLEEGDIIEIL